LTTDVADSSGKFVASAVDIVGKFTAGIVDTVGKFTAARGKMIFEKKP
jgi:hypothetical protein